MPLFGLFLRNLLNVWRTFVEVEFLESFYWLDNRNDVAKAKQDNFSNFKRFWVNVHFENIENSLVNNVKSVWVFYLNSVLKELNDFKCILRDIMCVPKSSHLYSLMDKKKLLNSLQEVFIFKGLEAIVL